MIRHMKFLVYYGESIKTETGHCQPTSSQAGLTVPSVR